MAKRPAQRRRLIELPTRGAEPLNSRLFVADGDSGGQSSNLFGRAIVFSGAIC
jgi:hypothetical protein